MRFDGIVFDMGNTLIPWDEAETRALYAAYKEVFESHCGPAPDFFERAHRARDRLIEERERTTQEEVTVEEFVAELCVGPTPAGLPEELAAKTHEAFLEICRVPGDLRALLDRLGRNRPLAVLSNFFVTGPIEAVLQQAGLWDCFVHVEISATGGYMKPHPAPFETVREMLGTEHERTLMVGDNFWADVVGGHRAGFWTALTQEYREGPTHDPRAPGVKADLVIGSLHELEDQA